MGSFYFHLANVHHRAYRRDIVRGKESSRKFLKRLCYLSIIERTVVNMALPVSDRLFMIQIVQFLCFNKGKTRLISYVFR